MEWAEWVAWTRTWSGTLTCHGEPPVLNQAGGLSLLSWNKSPSVVRWCWVWTLVHSDKGLFWQLKQQNLQSILQLFVPKNTSVFISPPPNFRVVRHGARTSHPVCDVVSVRASTVETLEIDGECEGEASCALNAM